jgi:hypothetical protein
MITVKFLPLETSGALTLGLAPWFVEQVFPHLLSSEDGCRLLMKYGTKISECAMGGTVEFENEDHEMLVSALQQSLSGGRVKSAAVLILAPHISQFYSPSSRTEPAGSKEEP